MDFWLAGQLRMKQMQMCASVAFFSISESKHMHRTRAPLDPLCLCGCVLSARILVFTHIGACVHLTTGSLCAYVCVYLRQCSLFMHDAV